MSHAVTWFQIGGPNGAALQKFYAQAFGWSLQNIPGDGNMKMVPAGKDGIPGGVGTTQNKQASVAVFISVGDVDAQLGKVERAGGRIAMPKTDLPAGMGSIGGFLDPAGNWIGLWMPPASAGEAKAPAKAQAKATAKAKAKAQAKAPAKAKAQAKAKAKAKAPAKAKAKAAAKTKAKKR
ncbi:MAG: hypothetical protein JST00_27935 [Deltaproteobacteria bacterium]|nr:hypothetical protein [Deltaproteobacteria bacterium]